MNDALAKDPNMLSNAIPAPPQTTNIDPQSLSRVPLPRPSAADSPPSDDSSPSPSNNTNEPSGSRSRRQSTIYGNDDDGHDDDPSLKRKASEEDLDDEPTHKSQHTNCTSHSISWYLACVHSVILLNQQLLRSSNLAGSQRATPQL